MARKLTKEEQAEANGADYKAPINPEETKNMKKALRESLSPKPKVTPPKKRTEPTVKELAAAAEKVVIEEEKKKVKVDPARHAGGRPKKYDGPTVIVSYRLPEAAAKKLKVVAALKGTSPAALLIEYINSLELDISSL